MLNNIEIIFIQDNNNALNDKKKIQCIAKVFFLMENIFFCFH